jgi:menaquinone-dependent protoporphyrinogen oxidase
MQSSRQPRSPLEPDEGRTGFRVLVAYATRFGSTRGIAERIARRLRAQGLDVDALPVEAVDGPNGYDAVVFGSPVFDQRWTPEAQAWVERHRGALSGYPTWLFSVGTFGDRRRLVGRMMTREPRGIDVLREVIEPRDYRVFAGVIDRDRWPLPSRLLYHAFGGRLGDNRDWPQIDAWADGIARSLRASRPR